MAGKGNSQRMRLRVFACMLVTASAVLAVVDTLTLLWSA